MSLKYKLINKNGTFFSLFIWAKAWVSERPRRWDNSETVVCPWQSQDSRRVAAPADLWFPSQAPPRRRCPPPLPLSPVSPNLSLFYACDTWRPPRALLCNRVLLSYGASPIYKLSLLRNRSRPWPVKKKKIELLYRFKYNIDWLSIENKCSPENKALANCE